MIFWAYMLHCRGGQFYVGHTEDLEGRMGQHRSGMIPGFTRDRLPVELVWSENFASRIEALDAERRVKGWSRAKKMALIRGDWGEISRLAKGNEKGKDDPSTSSGRTVEGAVSKPARAKLVGALSLLCHPETPASDVVAVDAAPFFADGRWLLKFIVQGGRPVMPLSVEPTRADGLWKTTCFELFVQGSGHDYVEFNFSPSGQWAAYKFADYRTGMSELPIDGPQIGLIDGGISVGMTYAPQSGLPTMLGISAIIEETDGTKSYWALRHPPGAPDFHHPDCFALELPAPTSA